MSPWHFVESIEVSHAYVYISLSEYDMVYMHVECVHLQDRLPVVIVVSMHDLVVLLYGWEVFVVQLL